MNKFVAKAILALAAGVVIPGGAVMAQNTQAVQPSASVIAAMQALQNVKPEGIADAIKALESKYDVATLATAAGALGFSLETVISSLEPKKAGDVEKIAAAYNIGSQNAANFAIASAAGPAANNNNNNQIAANQNSGFSGSNNSSFSGGGSGGSTTKASGS